MKISIVIPVYNEKDTLKLLLEKVEQANFSGLEKEIIMVDDCSTDGTTEILKELSANYKVLFHEKNQGKGAAIRTAIKEATGDFVCIQDADLEYLPDDYDKLLPLLINNEADVVYGSRFKNKENLKNFILKNGDILNINNKGIKKEGQVPVGEIYVDGSRIGDVSNVVIKDRTLMSNNGILAIIINIDSKNKVLLNNPLVTTRGYILVNESIDLIKNIEKEANEI